MIIAVLRRKRRPKLRRILFKNHKTICPPKLTIENNVSVKKIDGENLENLDNNPAIGEPHIKEANVYLIPPLSPNEYEQLKESIRDNGQFTPIIVNQEGIIMDGVYRNRACKELGIQTNI